MLQGHFYHKTIRKLVAVFGSLFNEIYVLRYDNDRTQEYKRLKVPLSYALKENFLYDLAFDTDLQKMIQVQLPRMSFALSGMRYDPTRKLVSIGRNYTPVTANNRLVTSSFNPVPYDFDFEVGIYTRSIEDLSQIIEQIIPTFTPDYTPAAALIDDNGVRIERDIPIALTSVQPEILLGSTNEESRSVQATLIFTAKAYLFGPVANVSIIRKTITNVYDAGTARDFRLQLSASHGEFTEEASVYVGPSFGESVWNARVLSWANSAIPIVHIYSLNGRLPLVGDEILSFETGAHATIVAVEQDYLKLGKFVSTPDPNTANVNSNTWVANTVIQEFPNITG